MIRNLSTSKIVFGFNKKMAHPIEGHLVIGFYLIRGLTDVKNVILRPY